MRRLKVILDTNVILVSISRNSPYRPIFDAFLQAKFDLLLSTEILNEYVEKFEEKSNAIVAKNISEVLINARNVEFVNIYFNWNLIPNDPEDNKFVDCAVAGDAAFIVTNDKHFNVLKNIDFPKLEVISIRGFLEILTEEK